MAVAVPPAVGDHHHAVRVAGAAADCLAALRLRHGLPTDTGHRPAGHTGEQPHDTPRSCPYCDKGAGSDLVTAHEPHESRPRFHIFLSTALIWLPHQWPLNFEHGLCVLQVVLMPSVNVTFSSTLLLANPNTFAVKIAPSVVKVWPLPCMRKSLGRKSAHIRMNLVAVGDLRGTCGHTPSGILCGCSLD